MVPLAVTLVANGVAAASQSERGPLAIRSSWRSSMRLIGVFNPLRGSTFFKGSAPNTLRGDDMLGDSENMAFLLRWHARDGCTTVFTIGPKRANRVRPPQTARRGRTGRNVARRAHATGRAFDPQDAAAAAPPSHAMGQTLSTPRITPQDRAVFQLKQQRDKLRQHQTKLAAVVERHTALARRALAQGHPERARFYLRAKQHQQSTIAKTYAQLDTLEQLIGTIEFKLIEKDVLEGLRQGNAVLRELNREMSVERIEAVLDDLEEERVKVEEALEVLGRGLTRGEENEVEEEMARLAAEALPQTPQAAVQAPQAAAPAAADLPRVPPLPMAPTGELEDAEEETSREEAAREEAPVAA